MAKPTIQEIARERMRQKAASIAQKMHNEGWAATSPTKYPAEYRDYDVPVPISSIEEGFLHPYEYRELSNWRIGEGKNHISNKQAREELNKITQGYQGEQSLLDAHEMAAAQMGKSAPMDRRAPSFRDRLSEELLRGGQSYKHGQSRLEPEEE